jgi:hypothetical protein
MATVKPPAKEPFAVCLNCERYAHEPTENLKCKCGEQMTKFTDLKKGEQISYRAQAWFRSLREHGLEGFSPGWIASRLGCSRSMVEKLVTMGVLEKSIYDRDGILMIFISERSLEKVLKSKRRTGKWTKVEVS